MKIICCKCNKFLGRKKSTATEIIPGEENISHSICNNCNIGD